MLSGGRCPKPQNIDLRLTWREVLEAGVAGPESELLVLAFSSQVWLILHCV